MISNQGEGEWVEGEVPHLNPGPRQVRGGGEVHPYIGRVARAAGEIWRGPPNFPNLPHLARHLFQLEHQLRFPPLHLLLSPLPLLLHEGHRHPGEGELHLPLLLHRHMPAQAGGGVYGDVDGDVAPGEEAGLEPPELVADGGDEVLGGGAEVAGGGVAQPPPPHLGLGRSAHGMVCQWNAVWVMAGLSCPCP